MTDYCAALKDKSSKVDYEMNKAENNFRCGITGFPCVGHIIEEHSARGGSDYAYSANVDTEIMDRCPLRKCSKEFQDEITERMAKERKIEDLENYRKIVSKLEKDLK
ncbi:MAG: hypothetical protein WCK29_00350 [archaeon]